MTPAKRTEAAGAYFDRLRLDRSWGTATAETSHYTSLDNLLTAVGATLDPKVHCLLLPQDQGSGYPDMGLYSARQNAAGTGGASPLPDRGVVEVKPPTEDVREIAETEQVKRYGEFYGLVLVTNLREFLLQEETADGDRKTLETFTLAKDAEEFGRLVLRPLTETRQLRARLGEFLYRALNHRAAIAQPRFLAAQLASYAREALERVEAAGDAPQLTNIRAALEATLGVRFEGEDGDHFFRSTLVQTLFYGVFSAWVLWARETLTTAGEFRWRDTVWNLNVPLLQELFQQMAAPGQLQPLGLVEVLDWTAAALDRVDRTAFFRQFSEGEAVPYFYEPFLEAFDPNLRKQLGVWYTPPEVVRYMVARVDRALKDDLGIAEGLAAENVYVLDPCCGTGAYLAETLRRINANLGNAGALRGDLLRKAATERVFGFEIMSAPYVIAHMQVGLTLRELDAVLPEKGDARPAIYLTNALTGWEPRTTKPLQFSEMEKERDHADEVKQRTPILVILGNPPYNGFAGMAVDEERELSEAYRTVKNVRKPTGQGLNDPYVRFFRMAERRIAEKTGKGVVCFISNYSWLDRMSHTGMRERYLEAFDAIRIDCLNGDRFQTGKTAPDGSPDPSIFSTPEEPVGIEVGTAIATLVRNADHTPAKAVSFRHLWGQAKREELAKTAEDSLDALYEPVAPVLELGLPFTPAEKGDAYLAWPTLPDLFPQSFPGVKTSRDAFLVDIDRDRLEARVAEYFDGDVPDDEIARRYPAALKSITRFEVRQWHEALLASSNLDKGRIARYAYRPFDDRWLYWTPDSGLLDRPRREYMPHVFEGNLWMEAREREAAREFARGSVTRHLADNFGNGLSSFFPAWLVVTSGEGATTGRRQANLSPQAERYLGALELTVEDLFRHALATLHDPFYREANAGALRMGWPRIPCPGWPDGGDRQESRAQLLASAKRGRELARLLDTDTTVTGVTSGELRPELSCVATPATVAGNNMADDDYALTASWGHFGSGKAVMPGRGRIEERPFTDAEQQSLGDASTTLGESTFNVCLNDRAYWSNVPRAVWEYKLGGYQVLKKWLSYRERKVLGRDMKPEEVAHFRDTARRIAAILLLTGS